MRVLHIDTERGWRGGERQALWLAVELARRGHFSTVAARRRHALAQRAREAGLPVINCSPRFEGDPLRVYRLRRAIRRFDIDLVHTHAGHDVSLGALAIVGTTARLVISRRVEAKLRDNPGTRWKYSHASAIIAVSQAVADVLVASGVNRSRIQVVPDGIDVHRDVAPADPALLADLGVPRDAPVAVQVAQLSRANDPLTFVRAIVRARRDAPTLHGLVVGDGSRRRAVAAEIAKLHAGDYVHLAGYWSDAEPLIAAATVSVLAARHEGSGSALLDALFLGRPIAATTAGGIPEVVTDGTTGLLVPVHDADALGAAIARLANDPVLARRLGEAARESAQRFSVERMTDATEGVYQRVLAGGSGRRAGRSSKRPS